MMSRAFIAEVIEGWSINPAPSASGAPYDPTKPPRAVLTSLTGPAIRFDEELLSHHTLFLGAIGTGKTNAMFQLLAELRRTATQSDVFVVFDTKGDFRDAFLRPGDAVITNERVQGSGGVTWSLTHDLTEDPAERSDEIFEIASTIFAEQTAQAGDNLYFATAARDVFAGVVDSLITRAAPAKPTNDQLRLGLESSQLDLWEVLNAAGNGARRYLAKGSSSGPQAILSFMQQQVRAVFSGAFRSAGDFSVRQFVREKGGKALFIEYDIAKGAMLLPIYRTLLDLAIKEALGRSRTPGNMFFVMDEFALLPHLAHLANGLNFGRGLGLKFILGTQSTAQVFDAYGPEIGTSLLSACGTVFSFRLMDQASRSYFSGRFGSNRKRLSMIQPVASQGVQTILTTGNVVEDWDTASLGLGECIVALPTGPPFSFAFRRFSTT